MAIDVLSPKVLTAAVQEFERDRTYRGLEWLPPEDVYGYEVMWDVYRRQSGLAGIYAIDQETMPGHQRQLSRMFADLVRIQAARIIREEEIFMLHDTALETVLATSPNARALRSRAEKVVADSLLECRQEIDTTIEYLITQALQGQINWPPPGLPLTEITGKAKFNLPYNFNSNWNGKPISSVTGGAGIAWNNAASNPTKDILALINLAQSQLGIWSDRIRMICSSTVLADLVQNTIFRNTIQYTSSRALSVKDVRTFLQDQYGIEIELYNAQYSALQFNAANPAAEPTIVWKRFIPEYRAIFIPDFASGVIGNFMTGPSWANDFQPGMFSFRIDKVDPWNVKIGAGYAGFPKLTHPEAIMVFDLNA